MSNTSYKQIIPASDWYFRHENVSGAYFHERRSPNNR